MAFLIMLIGIVVVIYYLYAMAYIRKKLSDEHKAILSDSSSPSFGILLLIAIILSIGFLASEKWIERSHILPFILTSAIVILSLRKLYLYKYIKKLNFPIFYLRGMFINTIFLILGLMMIVWGNYFIRWLKFNPSLQRKHVISLNKLEPDQLFQPKHNI